MIFGALLIGVALVAVACGSDRSGGGTAKLETISTVSQFQRAFNAERGTARLVVLLSPT